MEFIGSTTHDALPAITFPDCQLDCGRDDSPAYRIRTGWYGEVFLSFDGFQTELEYGAIFVLFPPGIDKVKDAIVGPDSGMEFFVNSNPLRLAQPRLSILSGLMKFAILRQAAGRIVLWLIDHLGIRTTGPARFVVAFVDQNGSRFLDSVAIRGISAE